MSGQENAPVLLQQDPGLTDGDQYVQATASQDVALLESLSKDQQELAVTMMLDQSKQWLDRAMVATNPARAVSEFKAWVATVAEATKQKKLNQDIIRDATEMLRRSERALGVAIRDGQDAGEIGGKYNGAGSIHRDARKDLLVDSEKVPASVYEFAKKDELTNTNGGIYDMTDGVSDEQFEDAIAEAKAEGNLSRANVVRKIKNQPTWSEAQAEKWATVGSLATDGLTSAQIAKRVGMTESGLRKGAKDHGITFRADQVVGRTRRINGLEVLERIVSSIEADHMALELVEFDDITPEQAAEWLQRLAAPLKAIRNMNNRLKEISGE